MTLTPDKYFIQRNLIDLGISPEVSRFISLYLTSAFSGQATRTIGTFGSEFLVNGTFTGSAAGWTSTGWAYSSNSITHNTGNTSALSQSISISSSTNYLISYAYSGSTAGSFVISVNGTTAPSYNTIETGVVGTYTAAYYSSGVSGAVTFAITPTTDFNGTLDNISFKAVSVQNSALATLTDYANAELFSIRGLNSLTNLALGLSSLINNVTGTGNTAFGRRALTNNISGNENCAFGLSALDANTTGFGNSAFGWNALASNTSGFENTAFGHNALFSNTTGAYNFAIGEAAMYYNTSGFSNVALGVNALELNTTGTYNIAFGSNALTRNSTGNSNISIGIDSSTHITTGSYNCNIGRYGLNANVIGLNNSSFGTQALTVALGNGNSAFGQQTLDSLVNGENNTAIGNTAGGSQTAGNNNITIGYGANCNSLTGNNQLSLGNSLYGDISAHKYGIGVAAPSAGLHLRSGTAAAGTSPLKFSSGTNLTSAEAGVIEYTGRFFITDTDATRYNMVMANGASKTTAGAPYTNDGYITLVINGNSFKVMTTA